MTWCVEYYSSQLQELILALPPGILARYLRLTDLMTQIGPNLGMPHTRAFGEGLFELRMKGPEGISRVFFCTLIGRRIVMLHCFVKKSQKTPPQEIALARRRLHEVMHENP